MADFSAFMIHDLLSFSLSKDKNIVDFNALMIHDLLSFNALMIHDLLNFCLPKKLYS